MMREAGHTKRFHTMPTIGEQTVAEHSFHVCMLALELTEGKASAELLKACLFHDLGESVTGDVPGHFKWRNPALKAMLECHEGMFMIENGLNTTLTSEEVLCLSLADSLELAFYAVDQLMLGNRRMKDVYQRIVHHISKMAGDVFLGPMWTPYSKIMERLGEKYHEATF